MRRYVGPVCAVLLACVPLARAEDKPRDVIERAIKAHGGEERLSRITCDKVKVQGVLHLKDDDDVPFTTETLVQLPGQFKSTVNVMLNGKKVVVVQVLNGDKMSVSQDGQPMQLTAAVESEMKETMHLERAVRLVPLLKDKAFELTLLDEAKVNDQPAYVVKAAMKGHKDLLLFIDKESNLLVKTEHPHEDPKAKKEVKQEEYYGVFKDLGGGFKRPTRITAYRDGKKMMDAQLLEVTYLDKVPEEEFTKP